MYNVSPELKGVHKLQEEFRDILKKKSLTRKIPMATYVTMFNYSTEGVRGISAARTAEAKEAIKRAGGKFLHGYDLLGSYDAMIIADYPDEKAAMQANMELNKLIGVSSNTMIAIPVDEHEQELTCLL